MSIPALHSETEQLFIMAETSNSKTLCVTACHANAGVTSLAMAMAERYLLAGYKTLLIDLNLHRPAFEPVIDIGHSDNLTLIADKDSMRCFQGRCCHLDTQALLQMRKELFLSQQLEVWMKDYQRIVIDTSPLLQQNRGNIPANLVASACDKTILSVLAGTTTKQDLKKALDMLSLKPISMLGTVLNQREQPTLSHELQREINRLTWLPARWVNGLKNLIKNNAFINAHS